MIPKRIHLNLYWKIFFYVGLIVYHGTDVYFDWAVYKNLPKDVSDITENNSTVGAAFLASCIAGTLLSVLMMCVYLYYIRFHRSFLTNQIGHEPLELNQRFITMELAVSLCELIYKELIQSSVLFTAFNSSVQKTCVSTLTRAFTACSLVANVKLLLCFCTKLCGLGTGEEIKSVIKALVCLVGCIGALLGLCFSSLYYTDIRSLATCSDI